MDRRLRKTEEAIQNALIELVVKEGYEGLKMMDVIDKADVNKSTFYLHYQSLLGVCSAIEDKLAASLLAILHDDSSTTANKISSAILHVHKNRKPYQAILKIGEAHVYKKFETNLMPFLDKYLDHSLDKERFNYAGASLFGSLFGMMKVFALGSTRLDHKKLLEEICKTLKISQEIYGQKSI